MNPADKRMLELLDRWLTSIELHLKYVELDEASYRQVQPWPAHERPSRWILELAQQKVLQLKSLCKTQFAKNDSPLTEALELMGFLANLVGAQNLQRFIPLADPANEQATGTEKPAFPVTNPIVANTAPDSPPPPPTAPTPAADDATREMPELRNEVAVREPDHTREMPKLRLPTKRPATRPAPQKAPPVVSASNTGSSDPAPLQEVVVADAVRLLKWGKQWHELAEQIARMAERPNVTEVRRILRIHRQSIEAQSRN